VGRPGEADARPSASIARAPIDQSINQRVLDAYNATTAWLSVELLAPAAAPGDFGETHR
jgi:hypothetical protein